MPRRFLMIFYHDDQGSNGITETDYTQFCTYLKDTALPVQHKLKVDFFPARNLQMLKDKLSDLVYDKEIDELYLHFSGHGNNRGIPYGKMIFENKSFAEHLNHPKISFCFFSSCESGELVKLMNDLRIPVVIGSRDANSISNQFAIQFQRRFYRALVESRTFENAFALALDEIKLSAQLPKAERMLVRGEGGKIPEKKLNDLQIVFDQPRNKSKLLIPPDFIKEITNADITKPFLLSVFDSPLTELEFQHQFDNDRVLNQNVNHINIPVDQLHLLNSINTRDVLSSIYSRLVVLHNTNTPLHQEVILHTMNLRSVNEVHYRPLFAIKNDVDKQKVLGDNADFNQKIGAGNVIRYDTIHELLTGPLSDQLIQAAIPYSQGRKIVLSINSKPLKNELYEMVNPTKFLRVFLGLTKNEKLINFLINGLIDSKKLKCKPIRIANAIDNSTGYIDEFKQTVRHRYSDQNFKIALGKMFAEANIIIFVDHQLDQNGQLTNLKETLEILYSKTEDFEDQVPSKATYVFFLFENEFPPGPDERTYLALRKFSSPLPIDAHVLAEWREKQLLESTDQIANVIREVADAIRPDEYIQQCPSAVIIQVCKLMKLPQQKIVNV